MHWAAEHFGQWFRNSYEVHPDICPSSRVESYKNLASQLIAAGADPHALSRQEIPISSGLPCISTFDPFISFLVAGSGQCIFYTRSGLADAVIQWGDMITDSGRSLAEYVSVENQILRSFPCTLCLFNEWMFEIVKLALSGDSRLAIEIVDVTARVPIFKARPIILPGAWPSIWPTYIPDTLIWGPCQEDEQDGFTWVKDGEVRITSQRYRVKPSVAPYNTGRVRLDEILFELHSSRVDESDDDLAIEARTRFRKPRAYEKQDHRLRRRAGSVPSLATGPVNCSRKHWGQHSTRGTVCSTYQGAFCSPRRFMQDGHEGCLPEPGEYSWEMWLLNSEGHHFVARKFAERFFPHLIYIVDRVLERATYRAQLAMGPKRPEDMDM